MNKTIVAGTVLLALAAGSGAASAQTYRPLTVGPHRVPAAPASDYGYDPYAGPGFLVTAPVHFAGTVAILPFRAVNAVFPAHGNTPLTLIGGPVYAAAKLVELPFRIVEAPFGGPNPFRY